MKTTIPSLPAKSLWKRLALVSTACCLLAGSLSAATISSGFEPTTNGNYTAGGDVIGKQDTSLGGTWTSIWTTPPTGVIFSSPTGQAGSTALRIASDGTSARGANLQVANAASLLTSTFSFSLAMNVQSLGTPTSGQQVQVQFGAQTFGNNSSWLKFGYDGGASGNQNYYIQGWNGSSLTSKYISTSSVTAGLGEWVTFNFTVDPFSHTYTSATITGSKGTLAFDLTGLQMAWDGTTTPSNYLSLVTGGGDVVTVDFDNVSISSIPEPAVAGLLMGGLLFGLVRRRRHLA
ncbi:MAG: hypothetical protein B9S32_02830 [Verrucomicrobia bacterium Tous-C9LFEB]|nr:MAG: hypothetical protein B9S32_02830 [Verrucomicrobia bacterium Tous-C9LFEB]